MLLLYDQCDRIINDNISPTSMVSVSKMMSMS